MPTAYTPGLRVTGSATVRKTRRLPLKGQVLVAAGDAVQATAIVARAERPGPVRTIKASEQIGLEPGDLHEALRVREGDPVTEGQVLAEVKSFFGLMHATCKSPVAGVVDHISPLSGYIAVREPPVPIEMEAYVAGRVAEVIPDEGVIIETRGAFIQGIFGVGGERRGPIRVLAQSAGQPLAEDRFAADVSGCVVIGGATASAAALARAAAAGAAGVVVGAIDDSVLREFVGYDIGVAITGQERVPFTLILTEGFGSLPMAQRTFTLLQSLEGKVASIDGATQIRAGVIRPEILVPGDAAAPGAVAEGVVQQVLAPGSRVRVIREPLFGQLAKVAALPAELREIETEARVRVAEVELDDGQRVVIPRANLEIIEE